MVPLMNSKDLVSALVSQVRLRHLNAGAVYTPGKALAVAEALFGGPVQSFGDEMSSDNMTAHIDSRHIPATPQTTTNARDQRPHSHKLPAPGSEAVHSVRWPVCQRKMLETVFF